MAIEATTDWYDESQTEFTISTPEQLAGLAKLVNEKNDFKGKNIKLGQNIALNDTKDWENWETTPPANVWSPIGTCEDTGYGNPFSGTFDGNGFNVSGVYINSTANFQGLFGYIDYGAVVRKLGVVNFYVKGNGVVGGLIGAIGDGGVTVENCYATGNVAGNDNVGILAGNSFKGSINNCYSAGTATGNTQVGGLVGYVRGGNLSNSYSIGTATGKAYIGGLVGENMGKLINNWSAVNVTGERKVGGFSGDNSDKISNCYSVGKVVGTDKYVGGFTGVDGFTTKTTDGQPAFFVGSSNYRINKCYYDKEKSGQKDEGNGEGKTTAEMQSKEFADSLNFAAGALGMNAWVYAEGKYPTLSDKVADAIDISTIFASGNGTEAAPYIISTQEQVKEFYWLAIKGINFSDKFLKFELSVNPGDKENLKEVKRALSKLDAAIEDMIGEKG